MAKIMLDVGGFRGESARAALDPRFGFDRVYCFEPVRSCFETIVSTIHSPRLEVINAGLLDRTTTLPLFHAGTVAGSIYADSKDFGGETESCRFIEASAFFKEHIRKDDKVWMKLNCEGAECRLLLNLIESGEADKLTEVLLDLDARKIPSAASELTHLIDKLSLVTFSFHYPEDVQYTMVTNFGGIRNWLIVTGAISTRPQHFVQSLIYQAKCATDPSINGYYKIRLLRALRLRPPASVPTKANALVR